MRSVAAVLTGRRGRRIGDAMKTLSLCLLVLLGGCVAATTRPTTPTGRVPIPYTPLGLERVNGQPAAALVALFGQPDADVREGTARKLQFQSGICVLDAYLYPPVAGAEPRVTYLDAREPDGSAIDRASCVAALVRRDGGR